MRKFSIALLVGMLCLLRPAVVVAQDLIDMTNMSLEDLMNITIVAASKKVENSNDAPGIITVISDKEIKGFAANNLGEVLNRVVGTSFLSANVWTDNVVQFRGQSITPYNNHVLILLNGRPLRDPISGGLNAPVFTGFPIDAIDHIEIIRGPGSVLYGSCAFSGVINIVTKKLENKQSESYARIGAGSWNTWDQSVSIMNNNNDFQMNLSIYHSSSSGPLFDFFGTDSVRVKNNFGKKNLGMVFNASGKRLKINGFLSSYQKYSIDGADLVLSADPYSLTNHLNYQSDITYLLIDKEKLDVNCSFTYNRHEIDLADNNDAIGNNYLFEVTGNYSPVKNANVVVGGIYEVEDYYGSYLINNTLSSLSFYTQMDYTFFEKYKLIGGVQYNKIENVDGNLSPRIGLVANFTKHFGAKLLYSQAFRKGYPLETSFNIPVFRGNLSLKPELINTFEAQIFYQSKKNQLSLTYYNSKIKQLIIRKWINDTTNAPYGGYLLYGNIDGSTFWGDGTYNFQGVEFEGKFSLNSKLFFTLNGLYQQSEDQDGVKDASLHPNIYLKAGLMYSAEKFQIGIFNGYFGKPKSVSITNPAVNVYNKAPEAYNLLSLKVSTDIFKLLNTQQDKELKLSVSGKNLLNLDVRYPEYTSRGINSLTPLMGGRFIYADLALKF